MKPFRLWSSERERRLKRFRIAAKQRAEARGLAMCYTFAMHVTVSKVFVLAAVLCFVLAVFHVAPEGAPMIPAGLAFFAASFLVP